MNIAYPVIAVNEVFLRTIGESKNIFNQNFELEKLEKYHKTHGLYIVGIQVQPQGE